MATTWTLTGFLLALAGFAQTAQFEVDSVKPHASGVFGMWNITTDPGRLRAEYVDMKQLIGYAYDVSPIVIAGDVPATRFDVEGKAEGAPTRAELRLMLQALLAPMSQYPKRRRALWRTLPKPWASKSNPGAGFLSKCSSLTKSRRLIRTNVLSEISWTVSCKGNDRTARDPP